MTVPAMAHDLGLCLCHGCGQACDTRSGAHTCNRCGAVIHRRKANAISRGWAFLLAALVFYIPANLLPVMHTEMLGSGTDSTIGGGLLLFTAQRGSSWACRQRSQLYRFVELIGYWSMLDVMVVALVAALVQLRGLGTIEPRVGILFFGMVVVLTMFSAMSFDPRLIWDSHANEGRPH